MNPEEEVIKIVAEQLGIPPKEISKDSDFAKDLNISRFEVTDLLLVFEEKFSLKIPEEELDHLKKVGDIINYISEHLDEPSTL